MCLSLLIEETIITKTEDLTGKVFRRWTVICKGTDPAKRGVTWLCICKCGTQRNVLASNLKGGLTKSCGCLALELRKAVSVTHGMSGHPAHRAWKAMRQRVLNPNTKDWKDYGGRGISICAAWDSFAAFWLDMGPSCKEGLTLDRIDVNGNYCKENCRWTNNAVQVHNQRKQGVTSQYIGVYFNDRLCKYTASITIDGKRQQLGGFLVEHDAAMAYDNVSESFYGDRPNKTISNMARETVDTSGLIQ